MPCMCRLLAVYFLVPTHLRPTRLTAHQHVRAHVPAYDTRARGPARARPAPRPTATGGSSD